MARAANFEAQRTRSSPLALSSARPVRARAAKPTPAQAAERRLLAAMADNPGLSVVALANAAGSSRSATGERLRQLALRGVVEKDMTGRWKLKGEERPRPSAAVAELTAAAEPEPDKPEPVVQPRSWIHPIGSYARHELARDQDATSYG